MNRINFTAKDNFPLSCEAMEMMQQMTGLASKTALLGGSNYILSGCEEGGNNSVSNGYVVINGELLPFQGGIKQAKITIQQTTQSLTAFGVNYPESYVFRTAVFSATGEYNWSDFIRVMTNQQLQQKIESIKGDLPGTVKMWSGLIVKIPGDYRLCDGSLLSIGDYPELFENIGVSFGGDGVSSFLLPDLCGKFIVGYNQTEADYNNIGKGGGQASVTLTTQQIPNHNHVDNALFNKLSAKAGDIDAQSTPGSIDQSGAANEYNVGGMNEQRWQDATIQSVGGGQSHENRPPYITLAYIIKVK